MDAFDWKSFLQRWSQSILESMDDHEKQLLPPQLLASGWLGYPGATEAEIARAEARLRVRLPPSYREFLKVSNGWRQTARQTENCNHRFWSTENIEQFAVRYPQWIKVLAGQTEARDLGLEDEFYELDDRWEPLGISDDDYFVYGSDQDPRNIRPEYLKTAIAISDVGFDSIYLLNPQVITPEGEWEAWFLADYLPGADRYHSFREMMEAEYVNYLEFKASDSEEEASLQGLKGHSSPEPQTVEGSDFLLESFGMYPESRVDRPTHRKGAVETRIWQPLKRLTVEFQTRQIGDQAEYRAVINPGELSQSEAWAGLTEQDLWQWLKRNSVESENTASPPQKQTVACALAPALKPEPLALVSDPDQSFSETIAPPFPQDHPGSQNHGLRLPLTLQIEQLLLRQTSHSGNQTLVYPVSRPQSQPLGIGMLDSASSFSVEVEFHLKGEPIADRGSQQVCYRAQFFVQNRLTHQWITLGNTLPTQLDLDRLTYTAAIFHQSLKAGMYRMQAIISLSGAAIALTSTELPLLNVI